MVSPTQATCVPPPIWNQKSVSAWWWRFSTIRFLIMSHRNANSDHHFSSRCTEESFPLLSMNWQILLSSSKNLLSMFARHSLHTSVWQGTLPNSEGIVSRKYWNWRWFKLFALKVYCLFYSAYHMFYLQSFAAERFLVYDVYRQYSSLATSCPTSFSHLYPFLPHIASSICSQPHKFVPGQINAD